MKHFFFVTVITLLSIVFVNAQNAQFGVKAGVNFGSINGDDTDEFEMRTSFHVGVVSEILFSEKFSIQPELLYSSQGAKMSEEGFDLVIKLNYINLPVMAKFYVIEGLSLEVGPQFGFLLSAKAKSEFDGESEEEDIKDGLNDFDFGINFGAGYKLENGLSFAARYIYGFSNLADTETEDDVKVNNGVIQLSVGFNFKK
jgi:hypothetical protein